MSRELVLLIAAALLSPGRAIGQSSWSQYKRGSLGAVIARERDDVLRSIRAGFTPLIRMSGKSFPTVAVVQFQDSTRPTSASHVMVLNAWAKSMRPSLDVAAMFPSEVLFREDTLN